MLHETVKSIVAQTEACVILLSVTGAEDVLAETRQLPDVTVLTGPRGSCAQRNRALASIAHHPACILFLDDDVELDRDYVRQIAATYGLFPSVAVLNGRNLAHGIYPAGTLDRERAKELLEQERLRSGRSEFEPASSPTPMATSYGCRMSLRGDLLGKLWFDERLVLYGFLEDLDFALRCAPYGSMAECQGAWSVHIEVATSRMGQQRRGYSEVINPMYLWSKKIGFTLSRALLGSGKRTLRNLVTGVQERDAQRLKGNLLGWMDAARGQLVPEKILTMK